MAFGAAIVGFLLTCAAFSACIYKRNYWPALFGVVLPLVWLIGALRLARPNSWWARRFYRDGEKMRRAEARYGAHVEDEPHKGWGMTRDSAPGWWWPFWSPHP